MNSIKKYSFLVAYLLALLPLMAYYLGGLSLFLPIVIVFGLIPAIDYWIKDPLNPDENSYQALLGDNFFKALTMVYVPIQCAVLAFSLYAVAYHNLYWYEWLGFVLSVGIITGGIGITVAHELVHKNTFYQQLFGKILLSTVCYGHFLIEHVRGHHVNVATPKDPASARYGESFYRFYPRTVIGCFKSAWHLEQVRLQRKNLSNWSLYNHFWWIILAPVFIIAITYMTLGLSAALFFIVQSIIAFSLLEVVNYVEHYGLARKQLEDGRYERVSPKHSWNANHWLTNIILFHLQRHSDHHTHAGRPYQVLRHLEESPQLPTGYAGMIVLALIPSLWFKVMNPKVKAYLSQQD